MKMIFEKSPEVFPCLLLVILLALCMVPAQAGTTSIEYRGNGICYVGDTVIFDGTNYVGNSTVITVTGPGLPAAGVPPYNVTGDTGTGNTVVTDSTGTWTFVWDSSRAEGAGSLNPGRYTFKVFDLSDPLTNATVSIFLKQPEFYASIAPDPAVLNDYVQVIGKVDSAADTIGIDVIDSGGNKVHTFSSPVSGGGYFQYGFHVDMPPGLYTVVLTSPSLAGSLTKTLTVVPSNANLTAVTAVTTPEITLSVSPSQASVTTGAVATTPPGTGMIVISSDPAGASVYLDSVLAGTSPVTLDGVAPGTHLVEIKSPGYLAVSMDVVVAQDKPTEVSPRLVKAPFGLGLTPFAALGGILGAAAILITVRKTAGKK